MSSFMLITRKASSKNCSWSSLSIALNVSMWILYNWVFLSSNATMSNFDDLRAFRFNCFIQSCKMRFNLVTESSIAVVLSSIDIDSELTRLIVIDIVLIDSLMSYNSWFDDFNFLLIISSSMIKVSTAMRCFLNIFLINNHHFHT